LPLEQFDLGSRNLANLAVSAELVALLELFPLMFATVGLPLVLEMMLPMLVPMMLPTLLAMVL
jgi:hypothetical protein